MQILKDTIRQCIIEEARKEFASLGYDKASMKVIASRCGISVGSLYKYFGSKERLFDVLVASAREAFERLQQSTDADEFYSIAMANRVGLRIMLFKSREKNFGECVCRLDVSRLCRRMCTEWLYYLLEEILMHRLTKSESQQLIEEYILMKRNLIS